MNKLEQILFQFRSELGSDFMSADVVGMDGISIAGGSMNPDFDDANISARFAEVMKLAVKISTKIDIGVVDDNLVTTDTSYILSRFLNEEHKFYWVVIVSSNATLGTVRMLMNEYAPQINDAIPHVTNMVDHDEANVKAEDSKLQDKSKQEKPKRNFWADMTSKKDDNSEEDALKTFKYP
jgi:predicted regulator of Ras-like GTPase activity (Roadblock/LC7/MglB family)